MKSSFGCYIALVASIVGSSGDTLLRIARRRSQSGGNQQPSALWMAGMALATVVDSVMTLFSLSFASASLVTPIAALRVALDAILAAWFLKVRLILRHYVGMAVVCAGVALAISASSEGEATAYTLRQLFQQYTQSAYLGFVIFCCFSVGLFSYVSFGKGHQRDTIEILPGRGPSLPPVRVNKSVVGGTRDTTKSASPRRISMCSDESSDDEYNVDGMSQSNIPSHTGMSQSNIQSHTESHPANTPTGQAQGQRRESLSARRIVKIRVRFPWGFQRFSLAAISGIAGGNANVIADSLLRMMNHPDEGGVWVIAQWQFFGLFIVLSVLLMTQIYALNRGIEDFEGLKTIPQANAVLITVACLASLNLFSESVELSTARLCLFFCGTCCVVWGIILLSQADTKREIAELEDLELQLGARESSIGFSSSKSSDFEGSVSGGSAGSDIEKEATRYVDSLTRGNPRVAKENGKRGKRGAKGSKHKGYNILFEDGGVGREMGVGYNVYGKRTSRILSVGPESEASNSKVNLSVPGGMNVASKQLHDKFGSIRKQQSEYIELVATDSQGDVYGDGGRATMHLGARDSESSEVFVTYDVSGKVKDGFVSASGSASQRQTPESNRSRLLPEWTESLEQITINSPGCSSASPVGHGNPRNGNLLDLESNDNVADSRNSNVWIGGRQKLESHTFESESGKIIVEKNPAGAQSRVVINSDGTVKVMVPEN